MIISVGTVVSGLMSERLTKKFSAKWVTVFCVIISAVSLFGFSTADNLYKMCLWSVPYGLSAGSIDAALNNYVALHYNSRHMNWLHSFWGVGTIVSPYIMSYALTHFRWADGYRIVAYIQFFIALILVLSIPLWRVNQSKEESAKTKAIGLTGAFKIKGVPYILLAFFAYCAAEATVMLWASSYFEGLIGAAKEEAAALGALVYIGITAGRFLVGFVSDKFGDNAMIKYGTLVAIIGVLLIMVPLKTVTVIGFIVIGVGCAPVYPSIIHSTPKNFGAENSQGIIGIQMASAYMGMTFMPPLFGLIANNISLKLMPIFLLFFFVLLIAMMSKLEKCVKP